jgi:hypothetical protein
VCGSNAALPNVFVTESVANTSRRYSGFSLNALIPVGEHLVLIPTYTLASALLTAAGPRLSDGPSTSIVGSQLPNRPMHRGGITVDGQLPRAGLELLANAQYTGSNNESNLGPYFVLNAGVSHRAGPGRVTIFENNIFDTYGGKFVTNGWAQPLPLSNGSEIVSGAVPLRPRSIYASYSVIIGGPPPAPAFDSMHGLIAQANGTAAAPKSSGLSVSAMAPPPGADPLSLATSRTGCTAEAQAAARPVLDEIRAYVHAVEAHENALPTIRYLGVTQHTTSADPKVPYYLELRPVIPKLQSSNDGLPEDPEEALRRLSASPEFKASKAITACAYFSVWTTAEAKTHGVEVQGGRPGIFYIPSVGLVGVRRAELPEGGGSLNTAK